MSILDLFFQPRCKICKTQIRKGTVCPFCVERLSATEKVSMRILKVAGKDIPAYYLFRYNNDAVKNLLFALKRKGDRTLFSFAAKLYEKVLPCDCQSRVIVNVPRSRENVKRYGYDHVKEPCRIMCGGSENTVYKSILKRRGRMHEQKGLNANQRAENVNSKFYAVKKDIPKNILLVDDVVTTGSTACECVMMLMQAYPDADIKCVFLASQEYD